MNNQNCVILNGNVIYEAKSKITASKKEIAWFTIIVNEDSTTDGIIVVIV